MAAQTDINHGLRGFDFRDVIVLSGWRADEINVANEEGHGDILYVWHIDKTAAMVALEPMLLELLEFVRDSILDPVLLLLNRICPLSVQAWAFIEPTREPVENFADFFDVLYPVWPIDGMNSIISELRNRTIVCAFKHIGEHIRRETRSQVDCFEEIVLKPVLFIGCQRVVH